MFFICKSTFLDNTVDQNFATWNFQFLHFDLFGPFMIALHAFSMFDWVLNALLLSVFLESFPQIQEIVKALVS